MTVRDPPPVRRQRTTLFHLSTDPQADTPMATTRAILLAVGLPLLAVVTGLWVYRDARRRGREELAPWLGLGIAGLFLAGSVPGLVALALSADAATQGFPTAIRVIPGVAALAAYARFR